jgi:hypothetical protein
MADAQRFSGEDENAGFASPVQDLIAAAFLMAMSVWIMIESVRLDIPGSLVTAPGLLPFLTAGSLCVMAASLAAMAIARHRAGATTVPADDAPDHKRTIVLVGLVLVYLVCLELVSFDYVVQVGDMRLGYGSFEVLTIIALTSILLIFWKQPLWSCLLVSVIWSTALAAAFRYIFTIPLPGSV